MNEDVMIVMTLALVIGGLVAYGKYLRYRRDVAMIEQGMDPRLPVPGTTTTGRSLESVLTTIGVGMALTLGLLFIGFGPWLLIGLIPLFIGLARLLALLVQGDLPIATARDQEANHGS